MSLAGVLFMIVAAVTAASAIGVAVSRSVIRSAVWLLFTLLGVAMLYLLLGAEFLSGTQLIVYVGGTMVLVVFGVMLTSGGPYAVLPTRIWENIGGAIIALLLVGLTTATAFTFPIQSQNANPLPGVNDLGLSFLGVPGEDSQKIAYLLPFEIVSVHLLVVLIAAAYLARAKKRGAS